MAISETKMQMVIANYFKDECDVNTSIRQAFEKGFRIGVKKGTSTDRPQGEWVEKPHKVYLPRDYEPDITDYRDRQYNEEDHSIIQYWWHCSECDYEADRLSKPIHNYCPNCGRRMKGADDD